MRNANFVYLIAVITELAYLVLSLIGTQPLVTAVFVVPAVFVFPGVMLLGVLRGHIESSIRLIVEGFFASTVTVVTFTAILIAFSFPLQSFTYSLFALALVLVLAILAIARKVAVTFVKYDALLILCAFGAYIAILSYFSGYPRLFTPDETSYIFSARMGILEGNILPMGVRPDASEMGMILQGRFFWIYLLSAFTGSTGLPAYQAGLLSAVFLPMIALSSTLLINNKWARLATFLLVICNPLLLSFSILALNDLALSFYIVFAIIFFAKSFMTNSGKIYINFSCLVYSFLAIIIVMLIKPNILIFVSMWLILVYYLIRYRLFRVNFKYKILAFIAIAPPIMYELCIDIPYVISVWVLRSSQLAVLFGKLLVLSSPAEKLLSMVISPRWNPTSITIFTQTPTNFLDSFYKLLMPEAAGIIVSAVILILPFLLLSKRLHEDSGTSVLIILVVLSFGIYYLDSLSSTILSDVSRYSLWMIPVWIPLILTILQTLKDDSSIRTMALSFFASGLVILMFNIWLTQAKGGILIGYGVPSRLLTAEILMGQLIVVAVIGLLYQKSGFHFPLRKKPLILNKGKILSIIILLMLLSETYFSSQFVGESSLFKDHGLKETAEAIPSQSDQKLVFTNNYIYLRPYISDELFRKGLLLPLPDKKEDFLRLLETVPDNSMILISRDDMTTSFEYANDYIKGYSDSEIITAEKPTLSILSKLRLGNLVVNSTFDDVKDTVVINYSNLTNSGVNFGATPVQGKYGSALQFNGTAYVSYNNISLNVKDGLTISFVSLIKEADNDKLHLILSKGDTNSNGSYHVSIWDDQISFTLKLATETGVQKVVLSLPVKDYLYDWHTFAFSYDGKIMQLFVDGLLAASKMVKGSIVESSQDLELGRSSLKKADYFVGSIDELQISDKPISYVDLVTSYYPSYALKVDDIPVSVLAGNQASFKVKNTKQISTNEITVKNVTANQYTNRSIVFNLSIESKSPANISIIISTSRYSKIFDYSLISGNNHVPISFDFISPDGGKYWSSLGTARVLVIDDSANLAYNKPISIWDLGKLNILLLITSLIILIFCVLLGYKARNV